jgi:tRNA-(ms[2]io[6]A)-hydroxylase
MLRLVAATDPAWAPWAAAQLPELLVDHAHCERKAAGAAVALLFRYPGVCTLQQPLSALAREELGHFEAVLAQLARLGIAPRSQRPGPYAAGLHRACRSREPERLLDALLCCALIEARSCERLGLLGPELPDAELSELYRDLLAAEARHHALYVKLAVEVAGADATAGRLAELAQHEAEQLAATPLLARLHAGGRFVIGAPAGLRAGGEGEANRDLETPEHAR